jgi:hypothetical protein
MGAVSIKKDADYRVVMVLAVRAAVAVAGVQRDPLLVRGLVTMSFNFFSSSLMKGQTKLECLALVLISQPSLTFVLKV